MNEVKKVNLGREVFTIANDAYTELKAYVNAIEAMNKQEGVVDEVEARVAELLIERGASETKAVTSNDVAYIKKQLGDPSDFIDDQDEQPEHKAATSRGRKLYRDTNNAYLFGVASGLSQYTGIDVVLVRLVFIALAFVSGFGVFVYIALGILVPEAKSKSDYLELKGKSVNIKNLMNEKSAEQLAEKAKSASSALVQALQRVTKFTTVCTGYLLIAIAMLTALAVVTGYTVLIFNGTRYADTVIFPVGNVDKFAVAFLSLSVLTSMVFVLIAGLSLAGKKLQLKTWTVATMVGLILLFSGIGGGLSAVSVQNIGKRYNAITRRAVVPVKSSIHEVNILDNDVSVEYQQADVAEVQVSMRGGDPLKYVSLKQDDNVLTIDAQAMDTAACNVLCTLETPKLVVKAPLISKVHVHGRASFYMGKPVRQSELTIITDQLTNDVRVQDEVQAKQIAVDFGDTTTTQLKGLGTGSAAELYIHGNSVGLAAEQVSLVSDTTCPSVGSSVNGARSSDAQVMLRSGIKELRINGTLHLPNEFQYQRNWTKDPSFKNCIWLQ